VAVTGAAVVVVVGVTLPVEMLVIVGMAVLVIVRVGMLVGVCHAVVGVLVGVAMLVAVVMMAQMILVNVHTISPCFFLSLYPQKAGKSISISPETKKPPSDEGKQSAVAEVNASPVGWQSRDRLAAARCQRS
jgi:hypothetical protein